VFLAVIYRLTHKQHKHINYNPLKQWKFLMPHKLKNKHFNIVMVSAVNLLYGWLSWPTPSRKLVNLKLVATSLAHWLSSLLYAERKPDEMRNSENYVWESASDVWTGVWYQTKHINRVASYKCCNPHVFTLRLTHPGTLVTGKFTRIWGF
jgi:hypothetical protein